MNLKSMQQLSAREENVEMEGNYIEQSGTQFCVRSHNTQDTNFGCYPSKEGAEAKLRTIMGYSPEEARDDHGKWVRGEDGGRPNIGSTVRVNTSLAHLPKGTRWVVVTHYKDGGIAAIPEGADPKDYSKKKDYYPSEVSPVRRKKKVEAGQYGQSGWQYGRRMPVGYIPKRTISGFPKDRGVGTRMPNPSRGMGRGIGRGARLEGFADYGEPMAGTMSHSHIDPAVWFHPPSLTNRYKNEDLRIPTDNPRETNDKFLDVTKRNSKETNEQRMKLLKRSGPGGAPPQIPVRTTAMAPHSGVYQPSGLFAKSWPARTKQGRQFTAYDRRGVL